MNPIYTQNAEKSTSTKQRNNLSIPRGISPKKKTIAFRNNSNRPQAAASSEPAESKAGRSIPLFTSNHGTPTAKHGGAERKPIARRRRRGGEDYLRTTRARRGLPGLGFSWTSAANPTRWGGRRREAGNGGARFFVGKAEQRGKMGEIGRKCWGKKEGFFT
jgi:hypothetical protein